jgi:hypothetical protein
MKKIIGLLILIGFIVWACENPLEGFTLRFKEPIEKAKLDIRVYNVSGALPQNIKVSFVGPDSSLVVTNLNTKKFKLNAEGVMIVAVNPEIIPSTERPVRFSVIVDAPGYTRAIKSFIYTSQANKSASFPLFNESTPPSGVSSFETTINTDVTTEQKFISVQSSKSEQSTVFFRAGTTLKDIEQNTVLEPLNLVMLHFDNRGSTRGFLPVGGVATNPLDTQGKALADPFDLPNIAGFVSIELSNALGQIVKTLSKPLGIKIELNSSTINPTTGKAIQVGESIPICSYDGDKGEWRVEGSATIAKDASNGKLYVQFDASHLSYWIVCWPRSICRKGPTFTFKSQLKNVDLTYYCQLVDASNNKLFREYYLTVNDGSSFTLTFVPKDISNLKMRVFAANNIMGGDRTKIIAESAVVGLCEDKRLQVDVSSLPVPPSVSVAFDIVCPTGKVMDEQALPSQFRIQFSTPDANSWRELLTLTRTSLKATTYKVLQKGTYDFRASTDGGVTWPYKENKKYLNSALITYKIEDKSFCK